MKKIYIISGFLFVIVCCILFYIKDYYKAEKYVLKYLKDSENVTIREIDNGYFFNGPGKDKAIIFYPGAKVEYTSYAPLMNELANNGIDTFLLKMPFNIAFFGKNYADDIIDKNSYKNVYISGHSLGGVVASNYVYENNDRVSGLILLASYSTKKIDNKVLSIYGELDGVLNEKNYNKNRKNISDNLKEIIIWGGNHSGFGNYGHQKGDNKSTITNYEQQKETIDVIVNFIN